MFSYLTSLYLQTLIIIPNSNNINNTIMNITKINITVIIISSMVKVIL